ncbi:MAG: DUF4126 domain-containing protein [Gammaproteobacteria bacterium]|nr:DUF4126 domain-containing protein [Gammaproteobacteria bacterium]
MPGSQTGDAAVDPLETLALVMGVAWASGINLYAAVLMLGLMNATGNVVLPEDLQVLSHPAVLAAAAIMYCVEFFADKAPGVDSAWDAVHTFIRIPAGAVLAAAAVGEVDPGVQFAAFLVGGSLAATSHVTKAGGRVLINTSPEPISNWLASLGEDALVLTGLWTALAHPWVFLALLIVFIVLVAWLLPRIWRAIRLIAARVRTWFGPRAHSPADASRTSQSGTPT